MNRYQKANEGIHAPEELKERVSSRSPRTYAKWVSAVAAVLAVAIMGGIVLWPGNTPVAHAAGVIAEAQYPEMTPYPDESKPGFDKAYDKWWADLRAQQQMVPAQDGLFPFYAATLPQFLGNNDGENRVCSPLNLYMALAMLAETTDGTSRQQILDLLAVDDMDTLRERAHGLWNANYRDDGAVTSVLASSVWLNENVTFHQDAMDRLAQTYYASSYQGEMGSEDFNELLRDWLDEQTGGLLKEYTANIELDPNAILALAATIYFRVKWQDEFWEDRNTEDLFHGASGDVTAEFMHQSGTATYYWGDSFAAYGKRFEEGGIMWFLLPDEEVGMDALLEDAQAMEFLYQPGSWENQKYLIVNFSMPKFDVSSRLDLSTGLKALGVTDVFDMEQADFSPMTTEPYVHLSEAIHAARVKVDEEGVEAAAFTIIPAPGAAPPPEEEVDFVLDRPFLFAITSETGQLLFVGVVNQV